MTCTDLVIEQFEFSKSSQSVIRIINFPNRNKTSMRLKIGTNGWNGEDAHEAFDYALLRKRNKPKPSRQLKTVRAVDLFCSCGGLSLGAMEACRALGKKFLPIFALDKEPVSLGVYECNFRPAKTYNADITDVVNGTIGSDPTDNELLLLKEVGDVQLLLAGPPCQGYSDLNNYTRRIDARNALYERVARFVELANPEHVLIENVPTAIHGKERAVQKTIDVLRSLKYNVDSGIVDLAQIGVPQRRRRHIVIASASKSVSVQGIFEKHRVKDRRSLWWAISDLEDEHSNGIFATPSAHTEENIQRIRYLHENNIFELPNPLRPQCHKNGGHSYKSVYGRLKPDEPAQTITSGFGSPGQGRFIHPTRQRTLTPHEAARLQFFPDFFDFSIVRTRTNLAEMIGNAAPMKLSYVFCLHLLA